MATTDRIDLKERCFDGKTPRGADCLELIDEMSRTTSITLLLERYRLAGTSYELTNL